MAKIGSPLVPSERPSVQEPVFASGAGKISSNVPRQKINLMDGTNLRAAAVAKVEAQGELVNMGMAIADAYQINEKALKHKAQLEVEGEYKRFEVDKQTEFAQARGSKDKALVRDSYKAGLDKLNSRVKGSGWENPKDKAWAAGLGISGHKAYSDMLHKTSLSLYTENVSDYKIQLGENEKDFANKMNIDPITHLRNGERIFEKLYDMQAITLEGMKSGIKDYKTRASLARATLMATDYAKNMNPLDMPSQEQMIVDNFGRVGLPLTQKLLTQMESTIQQSFLNQMKKNNQGNMATENFLKAKFFTFRKDQNMRIAKHVADNSISLEIYDEQAAIAKLNGDLDQYNSLLTQKKEFANSATPDLRILRHWADDGSVGKQVLLNKNLKVNGIWDVEGVLEHIKTAESHTTNSPTDITAIRTKFTQLNIAAKSNRTAQAHVKDITDAFVLEQARDVNKRKSLMDLFAVDEKARMELSLKNSAGKTQAWVNDLFVNSEVYQLLVKSINMQLRERWLGG